MAELLNAFFYCDPPYTSGCGYDVTTTEGFDHERLRDTLKNIEGRFLLSYDDSPKVRELYKGFEMIFIFIHGTDTLHCNQKIGTLIPTFVSVLNQLKFFMSQEF